MNGRLGDLGLNSLYTYRCLILYCACLYIGWLLNMLTVQADFVPRRHNRPLDVGGGPNGFYLNARVFFPSTCQTL